MDLGECLHGDMKTACEEPSFLSVFQILLLCSKAIFAEANRSSRGSLSGQIAQKGLKSSAKTSSKETTAGTSPWPGSSRYGSRCCRIGRLPNGWRRIAASGRSAVARTCLRTESCSGRRSCRRMRRRGSLVRICRMCTFALGFLWSVRRRTLSGVGFPCDFSRADLLSSGWCRGGALRASRFRCPRRDVSRGEAWPWGI